MARTDLLRLSLPIAKQLRDWKSELPGGVSVARSIKKLPTNTNGHRVRLASIQQLTSDIELWLDRFTGSLRYYAGFRASRERPVKFLERQAAPLVGAAETRTEDDLDPNDVQLKRESLKNVVRKPVLELYPGGREFYYGRYFDSLPASESRAEAVLIDAIASFLRSVLAVAFNSKAFDPENSRDARRRILAQIVLRRGQGKFRRRLLQVYKRRCAITGSSTEQILEAVHITPYQGQQTNHLTNGLLLRSDLHTLFDLGLIGVMPVTYEIVVARALRKSEYGQYSGKRIAVPSAVEDRPSEKALTQHLKEFKLVV